MSDELTNLSAASLARLVRGREASPVEIVEAHLRRIEVVNPRLNAVVALAPDALERARELEAALMRGEAAGPLAGVPLTVKDTIDVAGLPATAGSRVRANFIPQADAPAVARLRAAGAIILGKTNTSELALDYTADNPVHGRTNNPVDLTRTPGGSSGGCAAAVAACLSAGSLGSDLVGSIRIPAHFCGVAGLKPTTKVVNGSGHFPPLAGTYALGASLGPVARRVEDLALLFGVLSGMEHHLIERWFEGGGGWDSMRAGLRGMRAAWYSDDGVVPVTEETRRAVEAAARALEGAGVKVSEERPPHVERGTEVWLATFSRATQEFVSATYAGREELAGPVARAIIERASRATTPSHGDDASIGAGREGMRGELLRWMETTPLVVCPVGAVPAPKHDAGRTLAVGDKVVGAFRAFVYAQAANVFDLSAATVPAGVSREGLPVGVQIVGRPRAEGEVLAAARVVEEALGAWHGAP